MNISFVEMNFGNIGKDNSENFKCECWEDGVIGLRRILNI